MVKDRKIERNSEYTEMAERRLEGDNESSRVYRKKEHALPDRC